MAKKGLAIEDGESLGQAGDTEIRVRFDDHSAIGIEGPVIKLVYEQGNVPVVESSKKPVASMYSIPVKSISQPRTIVRKETDRSKSGNQKPEKRPAPVQERSATETSQSNPPDQAPTKPVTQTPLLGQASASATVDASVRGSTGHAETRRRALIVAGVFFIAFAAGALGWYLFLQLGITNGDSGRQAHNTGSAGRGVIASTTKNHPASKNDTKSSTSGRGDRERRGDRNVGGRFKLPPVPVERNGVESPSRGTESSKRTGSKSVDVGPPSVQSMVYSGDNRWLVASTNQGSLQVYDAKTMKRLQEYSVAEEPGTELPLAMAGFANRLFVGGNSGNVYVYEIEEAGVLNLLGQYGGHESAITCLAAGPHGKVVCSCEKRRMAVLWNVDGFEPVTRMTLQGSPMATRFSGDGEQVMVVDSQRMTAFDIRKSVMARDSFEGAVRRSHSFRTTRPGPARQPPNLGSVKSASISANLGHIALRTRDHIMLFTYAEKLLSSVGTIRSSESSACIEFGDDGKHLYSGTTDVVVWDYHSRSSTKRLPVNSTTTVSDIAVSPDGSRVAAVSSRSTEIRVVREGKAAASRMRPAILARFPKALNTSRRSHETLPETINPAYFEVITELDHDRHEWDSVQSVADGRFFVVRSDRNDMYVFDAESGESDT